MKTKTAQGKSWYGKDARSFRLVLTTADLANLLGWTIVRTQQAIRDGELALTGDARKDFFYLHNLIKNP